MKASKRLARVLPWLFLAAVAALTLYMDAYVARNILDGDASDYLCRGYYIAQSGNPFLPDYYYTTELRLVDSPLIFSIFFHFIENWTMVRFLGTALMQGLYVLSFLFLCRSAHLTWGVSATSAALLLLPFSTPYARIVLYHVYYINYLAEAFLMLGLAMRLMECRDRRKAILPGVALAALWAFVGTNGVRHMMILGAPMLMFTGVCLLRELQRYTWQHGRLMGELPFARTNAARLTAIMLASCVCYLIGYIIYSKVLVVLCGLQLNDTVGFYSSKNPARIYANIPHGWLQAIGARPVHLSLMGLPGLALGCALLSFGYLLWVSWASLRGMAPQDAQLAPRLMSSLFVCSMIVNTLIFVLDGGVKRNYILYYVPVVSFALPTLALEVGKLRNHAISAARKLMIVLTCACLIFQGFYTVRYLTTDREMDTWSGLYMTDSHLSSISGEYASFMLENGYTHALAPYWHANVMMELTDGALTVAPQAWEEGGDRETFSLYRWGTSRSAFAKENLPPKLLIFVEPVKVEAFEASYPHVPLLYAYAGGEGTRVYEITPDDIPCEPPIE